MLHLLLCKAQQCSQRGAAGVPVLLGEAREVNRDELLIVAKQVNIAKGANMVE